MAKTRRNEPCPCGSGNKYKRCCLSKDEAATREQLAAAVLPRLEQPDALYFSDEINELIEKVAALKAGDAAVTNFIQAGKLDEAEQTARDLLMRFPQDAGGHDCLGMVHEARGETRQAADCYRKVLDIVRVDPESWEPGFQDMYAERVSRLDPPA